MPNVLCDVNSMSSVGILIIGINGMIFPLFVGMVSNKKSFALWYISQVITGISAYAFLVSTVALIMNKFGFQMPNEDVIKVLQTIPNSEILLSGVTVVFMVFSLWLFIYNKPIRRMLEYLEIKNPRIA